MKQHPPPHSENKASLRRLLAGFQKEIRWVYLTVNARSVLPASLTFSLLGLVAAIRAEKFDQISQISSFVVLPLTYLGGVFYSVDLLPPAFRTASLFNPMLYMVDGVRFGFLGVSDINPAISLVVVNVAAASLFTLAYFLLRSGYRLRT